jgi:hypothetical protein
MVRRSICALLLLGPIVFPSARVEAQNVTLDEGTFVVTMADGATGTETFTIRQAGGGPDARVIAQARIQWSLPSGERAVVPLLEARGGGLFAYQVEVSGDTRQEIYLRAEGRRFVANVRSDAGEQQREYRARPGSVLLEQGVAHQYFVPARGILTVMAAGLELGPIPVLTPLAGSLDRFDLTLGEVGTVEIGGQPFEAHHLVLVNGEDRREVWFDDEGRVLRVEVPSLGYVAERQAPPRG